MIYFSPRDKLREEAVRGVVRDLLGVKGLSGDCQGVIRDQRGFGCQGVA